MKRPTLADVLAQLRAINASLSRASSRSQPRTRTKPAKRRLETVRETKSVSPARVLAEPRPKREPYNPPRSEPVELLEQAEVFEAPVEGRITPVYVVSAEPVPPPLPLEPTRTQVDRATELAALIAPARAAEAAAVAAQREVIEGAAKWRGPCKAVCALSGRACGLLAGHAGDHRNARGSFRVVAVPGQTHFASRAALDAVATSGRGPGFAAQMVNMGSGHLAVGSKERTLTKAIRRNSAHAGDVTADDTSVASARARGSAS